MLNDFRTFSIILEQYRTFSASTDILTWNEVAQVIEKTQKLISKPLNFFFFLFRQDDRSSSAILRAPPSNGTQPVPSQSTTTASQSYDRHGIWRQRRRFLALLLKILGSIYRQSHSRVPLVWCHAQTVTSARKKNTECKRTSELFDQRLRYVYEMIFFSIVLNLLYDLFVLIQRWNVLTELQWIHVFSSPDRVRVMHVLNRVRIRVSLGRIRVRVQQVYESESQVLVTRVRTRVPTSGNFTVLVYKASFTVMKRFNILSMLRNGA